MIRAAFSFGWQVLREGVAGIGAQACSRRDFRHFGQNQEGLPGGGGCGEVANPRPHFFVRGAAALARQVAGVTVMLQQCSEKYFSPLPQLGAPLTENQDLEAKDGGFPPAIEFLRRWT
jgi:hypothetical protein